MAYNAIKNFIMRRLGFPRVKVYLTEEQLDDCIWEAINWYFEWRDDIIKLTYLQGSAGTNTYDVPPNIVRSAPGSVVPVSENVPFLSAGAPPPSSARPVILKPPALSGMTLQSNFTVPPPNAEFCSNVGVPLFG